MNMREKLRNYHEQYQIFLSEEADFITKNLEKDLNIRTRPQLPEDYTKSVTKQIHEEHEGKHSRREAMVFFEEYSFSKAYRVFDKEYISKYMHVCDMYLSIDIYLSNKEKSRAFFAILMQDILKEFEPAVESSWKRLWKPLTVYLKLFY